MRDVPFWRVIEQWLLLLALYSMETDSIGVWRAEGLSGGKLFRTVLVFAICGYNVLQLYICITHSIYYTLFPY